MNGANIRAACLLGAAALLATKLWAGLAGDLAATMAAAGSNPWDWPAVAQLYLGMAAFALVLWRLEPDRRIAAVALIALPFIGNAAFAIWLALRSATALRR